MYNVKEEWIHGKVSLATFPAEVKMQKFKGKWTNKKEDEIEIEKRRKKAIGKIDMKVGPV
jgi:hypothetical protein